MGEDSTHTLRERHALYRRWIGLQGRFERREHSQHVQNGGKHIDNGRFTHGSEGDVSLITAHPKHDGHQRVRSIQMPMVRMKMPMCLDVEPFDRPYILLVMIGQLPG